MNLIQRYRKLTLWNKIGLLGSLITIMSFLLYLLHPQLSTNNSNQIHTISNSDGNVVVQSNRDVIINSPLSIEEVRKDSSKNKSLNKPNRGVISNKDSSKILIGPNSVVSINQQGGQTASTINNITVNSSDRFIPPNIASALKEQLSKYKNRRVSIRIANNDLQSDEPIKFAEELYKIFSVAGWKNTLSNSGNMIANGVVTRGITVNAIGKLNVPVADFICKQFSSLGYRVSCKSYSLADEQTDMIIEVWTK